MNRRTRALTKSSPTRAEQFHKYLKPGVLARIRDSRISARSHRLNSMCQISLLHATPPSSPPSNDGQPQVVVGEGFPCFVERIFSPRCPQRKKLVAAKSVLYIRATSPSNPAPDSSDLIIDSFSNNDIVVAN
ncbi:rhomboid family member [Senna tora]|uniref:Rhomboid family member n=1 Tax=Senna tora TaxID=362788 RepID=A0A834TJ67_9FABA|nr:rhomboid family member [Senna tora]